MSDMVKQETGTDVATAERTRTGRAYNPRFDIVETEDELILYGRERILREIGTRPDGPEGDSLHLENVNMAMESEGRLPPDSKKRRKNILKSIFKKR